MINTVGNYTFQLGFPNGLPDPNLAATTSHCAKGSTASKCRGRNLVLLTCRNPHRFKCVWRFEKRKAFNQETSVVWKDGSASFLHVRLSCNQSSISS